MENYQTLSEAINELRAQGYTEDFNLMEDCIECGRRKSKFKSIDFKVDKFFRFEGMTDPDDSSILFAISASDGSKGLLVDAYGTYSAKLSQDMIESLRMPH